MGVPNKAVGRNVRKAVWRLVKAYQAGERTVYDETEKLRKDDEQHPTPSVGGYGPNPLPRTVRQMEDMTLTKGDQTHKNDCHARQTMGWLRGLAEFKEHGAASLLQPTMISLGVPPGGLMNVRRDHATVRRVFAGAMQQGDKG